MKAIIYGLGSIGRRHMRLLQEYFPAIEIWHWNRGENYFEKLIDNAGWKVVPLIINSDDFAIISNPTEAHLESARACAGMGLHLFMEKPIGVNSIGLDRLIELVQAKNLIAYVAYPIRFHPFVQYLKTTYPAGWIHLECRSDASKWPSKRKLNHVVLELSHEIDLAEYLLGTVRGIGGNCSPDGLRCSLVLEHADRTVSTCLLDMASSIEKRFIRIRGHEYPIWIDDGIYLNQLRHFFRAIKRRQSGAFAGTVNDLRHAAGLFRRIEEFIC